MKKVLLILILFFLCYFIYNATEDNRIYYLAIGDSLSKGIEENGNISYGYNNFVIDYLKKQNKLKEYNNEYTNTDYRITDIIKILEYNEKKENSLKYLIKKADIITISLGMNELYSKLSNNNKNIYTYIDGMINNYDIVMSYIDNFHYKQVFILGYYNILGSNNDIINYANYKLKNICHKHNYEYIDLATILNNNPSYLNKKDSFLPNLMGYEKISQIIIEKIKNN